MTSLCTNTLTPGHEHFRNASTNDSVHEDNNATHMLKDSDMFHFIFYTVVRGPLCVIGFIANIICYNVLKADSGKKHHAATFLLQALAVADNWVLTLFFFSGMNFGLPTMMGAKPMAGVIDVYFKQYAIPLLHMAVSTTVWMTVLIAINRYIAVCRPLDASRLASLRRTKIQVAVMFTLSIIFKLPYFLQFTVVYPEDYNSLMVPSRKETSIGPRTVFGKVFSIIGKNMGDMIIPLILLIVLNTKIIWEMRKVGKWKDAIRQNGGKSDNNITVMMVVIIIVFIVCNIPYQIHTVAEYTGQDSDGWYVFMCVSHFLTAVNSSTNFLIYYVLRKSFRFALRYAHHCSPAKVSNKVANIDSAQVPRI